MTATNPTLLQLCKAILQTAEFLPDDIRDEIISERRQTWHLAILTTERFANPTEKARPILLSLYEMFSRKRESLLKRNLVPSP